uniref:Transcription factor ASR1 n=1 Tax=Diospyros kaki TaxID=35925 RepID=A0A3S8T9C6_DIOKA|nr:transcription factor ASR1 [Diospyros kaki]
MALEERLTLDPSPVDADPDAAANGGGDDGSRTLRLPRWTRQEILVLIQGKRAAESRVRRGRTGGLALGTGMVEPKWASVSSYCRRNGVNRGPVQCRKRWSNLAGDYKKIKEWESQARDEGESFWVMRSDLRREKKLPGFFDREVYNILDGGSTVAPTPSTAEEVEAEAVFDSGRSAAVEDGLFSDFEQSAQEEAGGGRTPPEKESPAAQEVSAMTVSTHAPISGKQSQPFAQGSPSQGATHGKQKNSYPETGATSQEGRKKKRFAADGDDETNTLQSQLIDVLERNGRMLSAQLESHNTNFQLDRAQRKDHQDSLVSVLNKLADALGRIADKL